MRMMICRGSSPGAVVRAETNASDAIARRIAPPARRFVSRWSSASAPLRAAQASVRRGKSGCSGTFHREGQDFFPPPARRGRLSDAAPLTWLSGQRCEHKYRCPSGGGKPPRGVWGRCALRSHSFVRETRDAVSPGMYPAQPSAAFPRAIGCPAVENRRSRSFRKEPAASGGVKAKGRRKRRP